MKGEGTALRLSSLRAAERRTVRKASLRLGDALFAALDSIDDLLLMEDITDRALTEREQIGLGHARTAVLSAFRALKVGAPDLTGLVPVEAMPEPSSEPAGKHYVVQTADDSTGGAATVHGPFPTDEAAVEWAAKTFVPGTWHYAGGPT